MKRSMNMVAVAFGAVLPAIFLPSIFLMATLCLIQTSAQADEDIINLPVPSVSEPISSATPEIHHGKIRRIIPQMAYIFSGYSGFSADSFKYKNGVGAGATADVGNGDFVFEPGFLYRQMGADFSQGSGAMTVTGTQLAGYISLPVDGKWYFSGQDGTSGYLKFGIVPSILLSNTVRVNTPFAGASGLNLNTFDVGYLAGLGAKIDLSHEHSLMVDASYLKGFANVTPDSNSGGLFNSAFILTAGYSFDVE